MSPRKLKLQKLVHALIWIVGAFCLGEWAHAQEVIFAQPRSLPFVDARWNVSLSGTIVMQINVLQSEGQSDPYPVAPGTYLVSYTERTTGASIEDTFVIEPGKRYIFRTSNDPYAPSILSAFSSSLPGEPVLPFSAQAVFGIGLSLQLVFEMACLVIRFVRNLRAAGNVDVAG